MDGNSICRLCALKSDNYVNVFDQQVKHLQLAKKIKQCLQILLKPEDLLPNTICLTCCDKVKEYSDFHTLCSQSQSCLMEVLRLQNNDMMCSETQTHSDNEPANETSPEIINIGNLLLVNIETPNRGVDVKMENRKVCGLRNDRCETKPEADRNGNKEEQMNSDGCIMKEENDASRNTGWFDKYFDSPVPVSTRKMLAGYLWKCTDCDQQLSNINALKLHYIEQHKETPKYKCIDCSKVYASYKSFVRHVKLHWNKEAFSCQLCGKSFSQKCILQSHMTAHSEERPFVCTKCGKAFKQYSSLYLHNKSHLPDGAKPKYPCSMCSKIFCSKSAMDIHMKMHRGEKDFICDICGKRFVAKGTLQYHIKSHDSMKPYACNVCSKTFSTERLLSKHSMLHTGEKPHQCDVCGKQFRERSALKEHYRIHTGDMPYSCEYCGKLFRFKGILTVHRRQHTGERPYKCKVCHHEFTNWANYNKHLKRRHKPGDSDVESDGGKELNNEQQQQSVSITSKLEHSSQVGVPTTSETDYLRTTSELSTPSLQDVFSLEPTLYDNLPLDLTEQLSDLYSRGVAPLPMPSSLSPTASANAPLPPPLYLYYLQRYIRYPEFLLSPPPPPSPTTTTIPASNLGTLLEETVRPK